MRAAILARRVVMPGTTGSAVGEPVVARPDFPGHHRLGQAAESACGAVSSPLPGVACGVCPQARSSTAASSYPQDRPRHGPIRALLGEARLSYFGVSYGTYLGAVAASF